MKGRKVSARIGMLLAILLIVLSMAGAGLAMPAGKAVDGGVIAGQVTSPGGYPLPVGTLVRLFDPGADNVRGSATPDPNTGAFSLGPVPKGLYVIKAVPPVGSLYTQSLPKPVLIANDPFDAGVLALTNPQVYGQVFTPDGLSLHAAEVLVFSGSGLPVQAITSPDGNFRVGGLLPGGYWLSARPIGDDPLWKSPRAGLLIPETEITQTVALTLTQANLWGFVKDEQGLPVRDAVVGVAKIDGNRRESDRSNADGFWALGGLADGQYVLEARPPFQRPDLLPPEPVTVTLPGAANPYTLTLRGTQKVLQGMVKTNLEAAVAHALVRAERVTFPGRAETYTGNDGRYELLLAPGVWAVTVRPVTDTVPGDWIHPLPPQLVGFKLDQQPETQTLDFKVYIADASVSGKVVMPDGGVPPFTVTVGLHNDEGIGLRTKIDPADGTFSLDVPSGGYKVVIVPHDQRYVAPAVDPITVPANGTYDLGTLTLLARDALITGTVTAGAGNTPLEGIAVVAWQDGAPGNARAMTGPDGQYALAVSAGTWHVQPAPGPKQPYLYTGDGLEVSIEAGATVPEVNFNLQTADATINGMLVDESGSPVTSVSGWVTARNVDEQTLFNGGPIEDGAFSINVISGTYRLKARLAPGSGYTSAREGQVSVAAGETTSVTLTVEKIDAHLTGSLWDPRTQQAVIGVPGLVDAWDGVSWALAPINPDTGVYKMDLAEGLWRVNYRITPNSGYAKLSGPRNIAVPANQTVELPLPATRKDGVITGTVLAPDGTPLAGALVYAKGVTGDVNDTWLEALSQADGSFRLAVPSGLYRLGASVAKQEWVRPLEREVLVPQDGASGGNVLQFRQPDAVISGSLVISNTTETGRVLVWAWSDDGGFARGVFTVTQTATGQLAPTAQATGTYHLEVISGMTWHLGAVFETRDQYWAGFAEVNVAGAEAVQDLLLDGPQSKPAPVVVTFNASEPQDIELSDGTHISIPAGAMPVEGKVTLRIVPVAALPNQQHADVLKYGYAFLASDEAGQPVEANFNQDVVITFSYTEADLLRWHIREEQLKPAYFSTTANRWTFPDSFVVDTEANQVVMQIDHFTDYALTGQPAYLAYIPLIVRK